MKWVRVQNSIEKLLDMWRVHVFWTFDKIFGAMGDLRRKNQESSVYCCSKVLRPLDENNEMILLVFTIVKTKTWI